MAATMTSVRRYHVHGVPLSVVGATSSSSSFFSSARGGEYGDGGDGGGDDDDDGGASSSREFLWRFYRNALVLPDGIHTLNYISWTKVLSFKDPLFQLGEAAAKALSVTPYYRQPGIGRDNRTVFPPCCGTEGAQLRTRAGCAADTNNSVIINWFASGARNHSSSSPVRISVGQCFGKDIVRWEGQQAFVDERGEVHMCTAVLGAGEGFSELRMITEVHADDIARIVAHDDSDIAAHVEFDEGVKKKGGFASVDHDTPVARYIFDASKNNKQLADAVDYTDEDQGDGGPRSCTIPLSVFATIVEVLKKEQSLCKPRSDLKKLSNACVRGECDGDPSWSATVTFGMLVAFSAFEGEVRVTKHFFEKMNV